MIGIERDKDMNDIPKLEPVDFTVDWYMKAMLNTLECDKIYLKDLQEAVEKELEEAYARGLDQGKSDGHTEGYEAGYGVGRSDGYENARRDFDKE